MKNLMVATTVVLSACSTVTPSKTATPTQAVAPEPVAPAQAQAAAPTQAAPHGNKPFRLQVSHRRLPA